MARKKKEIELTAPPVEPFPEAATVVTEVVTEIADKPTVAIRFLSEVVKDPKASVAARLDAAEALIAYSYALDLEPLLLRLMEPPGEWRERVRAARLLLGV